MRSAGMPRTLMRRAAYEGAGQTLTYQSGGHQPRSINNRCGALQRHVQAGVKGGGLAEEEKKPYRLALRCARDCIISTCALETNKLRIRALAYSLFSAPFWPCLIGE